MKINIKNIIPATAFALTLGMTSCVGDLDVKPIDPNLSTQVNVNGLFNKCYANIGLAGNGGANGDSDVDGIDGGTSGFVRQMFNAYELTTDEAVCGWGDNGIASFCYNTYDASHPMLNGFFSRLTTGIATCNHYLEVASGHDATMTAEVRFVRAFQYYLLMDAFGNIPFTTKLEKPQRYTRQQAYDFIEKELLEIEPQLSAAKAKKSTDAGYGRVDKAACWLLLSRLYLNAEIYTGTAQWSKAAEYAKKVMDSDYKINTTATANYTAYQMLFMGDNGETDAAYEAVFPILQDGLTTTSWGTSLYLIAGTFDANMHPVKSNPALTNGVEGKWAGLRTRPTLIEKFFPSNNAPNVAAYDMVTAASDDRALFDGIGRKLNVENVGSFTDGFAVAKFSNLKTDGSVGHSATFADMDFFLMRTAEAYLTYAEATARQNGNRTTTEGTNAINVLRQRAHASTQAIYTLDDILDEWSREFYFEGRRRMDLVRFNKFGGDTDYIWQWKGGVYNGRNFAATKNIFAIPSAQLIGAITQNPGYN